MSSGVEDLFAAFSGGGGRIRKRQRREEEKVRKDGLPADPPQSSDAAEKGMTKSKNVRKDKKAIKAAKVKSGVSADPNDSEQTATLLKSRPTEDTAEEGIEDDSGPTEAPPLLTTATESEEVEEEVVVETFASHDNCVHECVRPANAPPPDSSRPPREPARKFAYILDPFQAQAISCLERGESVLVSAHTSAGKTTVAEYAIAMGLRDQQRVIYTSPIKALSNQKYRDLSDVYGNEVGLMTGDVTLNPSASVMIMTTEILRSMLYKVSPLVREMKWVVFDEIHYMRDRDRGVVWEETIILLPDTVRLVFLSATVPNAREFAEWICRVKHQPCHVIYTDYRPVPLQHFVFPTGGSGVHLVMDKDKIFKEANYDRAMEEMSQMLENDKNNIEKQQARKPKDGANKQASDLERLLMMCSESHYTPVIVFSFSKREVEANARALRKICLTSPEEQAMIDQIFRRAMDTLGEDKNIPPITSVLPLLRNGIGLHHGGLLPIVKEIIEILFQESLVKVLFSTETFAMGINMPAKTVIFTKLKKWDGEDFRTISPGEYIQMSGRAGRRGLDERGICIVMLDEQLDKKTAQELFLGAPLRIESQFHLGYSMLLKLLRVEGASPEYLMRRSFFQFQNDKLLQLAEAKKTKLASEIEKMAVLTTLVPGGDALGPVEAANLQENVGEVFRLQWELQALEAELRALVFTPENVSNFISNGRIVRVATTAGEDWGYGVVVGWLRAPVVLASKRGSDGAQAKPVASPSDYTFGVVLRCDPATIRPNVQYFMQTCRPAPPGTGVWQLVNASLPQLRQITQVTLKRDLKAETTVAMNAAGVLVDQACEHYGSLPDLDPVLHLKVTTPEVYGLLEKLETRKAAMETLENVKEHPLFGAIMEKYTERLDLMREMQELNKEIASRKNLSMRDDLRMMRRVLRRLKYLGDKDVVTLKGSAACEISCVDELVLCELLFDNFFQTVNDTTLAMALSTMVYDEKSRNRPLKNAVADQAVSAVIDAASRVADVSIEAKMTMNKMEYLKKFKTDLCDVVEQWMNGLAFGQLMIPDDMFEGSVVRAIRRLEELLRQLACAARSLGDLELEQRFVAICRQMRRGLIFSSSLYL